MNSVKDYYKSLYGEPERQARFVSPEGRAIEIYKWNEKQTKEGVTFYATSGASDILCSNNLCCEFFIGVKPEVDDIAQALAETALHGNGTRSVPQPGDSISLSYPLWKNTNARNFLFTDGDEIIQSTKIGGKKIKFIQLVPLFDSELEFKKKHGEAALWEKFEEMTVPYWDSDRGKAF